MHSCSGSNRSLVILWGTLGLLQSLYLPGSLLLLRVTVLCLVAQSFPTLCNPMACSPPGPCVHGDFPGKNTDVDFHALFQGIFPTQGSNPGLPQCRQILYHLSHRGSPRILEWVAYPFSNRSSQPRIRTGVSCIAGRFLMHLPL